ncbi:RsmB/NOP family class I SAM-dependent RNA methyltransferase [Parashewanella spongiae]|uniref:RsmB/NOP family class I SAM-dependent RNA methyltransferase n=1 Tax=Parashewanella spongiae TaxID=342950 RepID=A0A3A6TQV1_9GAMM|nr:RsmB/NOP family class I SAM-dependent RNA methyltransferase [Parashewanella spongiae]MCL1079147.1 RsmB/NOP family class I SAM-dependent RNA methyltransferase [Parashewanella spongiae]RJY10752.1 RsmB/NOP family class I SAM-dependent RNA methyltransferase [Parashewanella spongiae]
MTDFQVSSQQTCSLMAQTPAQKRALSYALTIHRLFTQIMDSKQPADRVLAHYFRENKKHGSKDRRVIRETLFAMFRWWGWLGKTLPIQSRADVDSHWLSVMLSSALLEKQSWPIVIKAWGELANVEHELITHSNDIDTPLAVIKNLYPEIEFKLTELLPESFWKHHALDKQNSLSLVESMSSRPPIWARSQYAETSYIIESLNKQDFDANKSTHFPDAINLGHKSLNLNQLKLYQQGKIEIQDLASQTIGHVCDPKPNELWWDACSGAGGKALQLTAMMYSQDTDRKGEVVASDIRKQALDELYKRMQRAQVNHIQIKHWASEHIPVPIEHFDGVLVDAPCSCTGTWRRNPDMRWTDDLSTLDDVSALQLDILTKSSAAVKQGGRLIYATCSIIKAENEDVVSTFLANNPEFNLEPIINPFTNKEASTLTIWPYEANSDGMFVARMIKA